MRIWPGLLAVSVALLGAAACFSQPQVEIFNGTNRELRVGWSDGSSQPATRLLPGAKVRMWPGRRLAVESSGKRRVYDFGPMAPVRLGWREFGPYQEADGLFSRGYIKMRLGRDDRLWLIPRGSAEGIGSPSPQLEGFPLQGELVEAKP